MIKTKIIFFFWSSYWIFLFSRVFLEKISLNDLSYITTLLIILSFGSFLKFLIPRIIVVFSKYKSQGPESSKKIQKLVIEWATTLVAQIYTKIDEEFLPRILKVRLLGKFFAFWFYRSVRYRNNLSLFFWPALIIPWGAFLIALVWEVTWGNFLFFTLYLFSLNFLIKKLLQTVLYVIQYKNEKFLNSLWQENNLVLFGEIPLFVNFFLINGIIPWNWLFLFPETQTKTMLVYLWNLLTKITMLRTNWQLIDQFVKSKIYFWNLATQNCNLIVFSIIIILKTKGLGFVSENDVYFEAFFVFFVFSGSFCFFLVLLNFLKVSCNSELVAHGWRQFKTSDQLVDNFLWTEECLFQKFSEKYPSLENDLVFISDIENLPEIWLNNNFSSKEKEAYNSLNPQQKEILSKISKESLDWFTEMVFLTENIDMNTFSQKNVSSVNHQKK